VLVRQRLQEQKILTVYGLEKSQPAVVEVPFGASLRNIFTEAGVSLVEDDIRAIVVGGAEGGALPLAGLDTPYDLTRWRMPGQLLVQALSNCFQLLPVWLPDSGA